MVISLGRISSRRGLVTGAPEPRQGAELTNTSLRAIALVYSVSRT